MSRAKKSQSSTDPRILFGQRVAYLRKQIGWSQEKLALESNIARSYLGSSQKTENKAR
jgi:ribosome-binding protein aMBF1 (putative translation factor)